MTPQEMNELPAGRELDALVAEKVMGWRKQGEFWAEPGRNVGDSYGYIQGRMLPHYCTEIEAAWEVVERMNEIDSDGFFAVGDDESLAFVNILGRALDTGRPDEMPLYLVDAKQAALNICRAALKAVTAGQIAG